MNRITSLLALSAIVVAGAFAGTAATASASNVSVSFNVLNGDSSVSMIRTSTSGGITSLITPPVAILPGHTDPTSGSALFTGSQPPVGSYVQGSVQYGTTGSPATSLCTFNMRITHVSTNVFKVGFTIDEFGTNCSVPADETNSTGVFSGTHTLIWKS